MVLEWSPQTRAYTCYGLCDLSSFQIVCVPPQGVKTILLPNSQSCCESQLTVQLKPSARQMVSTQPMPLILSSPSVRFSILVSIQVQQTCSDPFLITFISKKTNLLIILLSQSFLSNFLLHHIKMRVSVTNTFLLTLVSYTLVYESSQLTVLVVICPC